MKEIIIKESNKERIESAIREAEGKAKVRTIDYNIIKMMIGKIEKKFNFALKKEMEGLEVIADFHAHSYPRAYKYGPESTFVRMKYNKCSWRLTDIYRSTQRKDRSDEFWVTAMPEALEKSVIYHYISF